MGIRCPPCDCVVLPYFGSFSCGFEASPLPPWFRFINPLKCSMGSSLSIPGERWECAASESCCVQDAGGAKVKAGVWMRLWLRGSRERSCCWDLHRFPYPSWETHFTVGGGVLMAVLPLLLTWGLFSHCPALEASLMYHPTPCHLSIKLLFF